MKDSFNIRKMNHLFRRINVNEIVKYLDKEAVDDLAKGPIDYENTIKYTSSMNINNIFNKTNYKIINWRKKRKNKYYNRQWKNNKMKYWYKDKTINDS